VKVTFLKFWDALRSSFWFLPATMIAAVVVLAYATVAVDAAVTDAWISKQGWAYAGGAEGASAVLSTIAGSMITVAGVVFSLTLVVLSQASSQFGPRLLRNFMRDTINQAVLGTFVATFLYCLLVLRNVRRADEGAFVPHLSVTCGVVLAVVSLGFLIYFIHHISLSIQADEVTARVGAELLRSIDRIFPEQLGEGQPDEAPKDLPRDFDAEAIPIAANADGYVQFIDANAILELAEREDLVLRIERRPGHYVVAGSPLVSAWRGETLKDDLREQVNAAFVLGTQRNEAQDAEFAVNQLVEVAVRALSPGINDPFTAMTCVDRLGSGLCRLAQRKIPSPYRRDKNGRLRVIAEPATFPAVADAALNQIRQYARTSAAVTIRLLEMLAAVASHARRQEDLDSLLRHAEMTARSAREALPEENDRRDAEERYQALRHRIVQRGWHDREESA
jgi:uncharacterized membrane protein